MDNDSIISFSYKDYTDNFNKEKGAVYFNIIYNYQ